MVNFNYKTQEENAYFSYIASQVTFLLNKRSWKEIRRSVIDFNLEEVGQQKGEGVNKAIFSP